MGIPSPTAAEIARLARLHELHILDTAREPLFGSLVHMGSAACEAPIALMVLTTSPTIAA